MPISKLISRLEDEVGVKLFHRAHGRLEPTPEASIFLVAIARMLYTMEQTVAISRGTSGIHVPTSAGCAGVLLLASVHTTLKPRSGDAVTSPSSR